VLNDYILYFLQYKKPDLLSLSQGGATRNALTKGMIESLLIPLPPLSKQAEIVKVLKSLDDKIEVNRRINDNLEQQAQALFRSWFVDFEPFKDGDFVESELGIIPKGWRVGTLSDLGEVVGGSTPSKAKPEFFTDNGIAWLTPKDLSISNRKFTSKGEIDITQEGYESCSTKLMPKGTVLFSSRAPIGYITIAKNDICTNQGFKSIVPKNAGTTFIYCFLKASTPEIENKATGSTFKEASGALMKNLPVIIPEDVVLDHFEDLMKPVFKQQEIIEDESRRLASLRDTILPRLMSGELRVNEIEK
jgi:type I restriction enzyme S subunit